MSPVKKIILFIFFILISALGYQYFSKPKQIIPTTPSTFNITETIKYSTDKTETFTQQTTSNETVFDVLTKTIKNIESKQYDFGMMINSINGVKSGTDSKYWVYSVNDQSATIAADKYILKSNDKIVWSFEALK
ncbi:MAG: DUF4430 domain-containing protein [Candidatus Shapirobacteria bacterium]